MNKREDFLGAVMCDLLRVCIASCLVIALLIFIPTETQATTSALTANGGLWTSASGASVFGIGTEEIFWGDPIEEDMGEGGMSGYLYKPGPYPVDVPLDIHFKIGEFTHQNRQIFGSSITSANLRMILDLNIDGTAINGITLNSEFIHNESANTSPTCCDDTVQMVISEASAFDFTVDATQYRLELLGFMVTNEPTDSFITPEGVTGSADIVAIIRTLAPIVPIEPPPIVQSPEPETYLIMGGTLIFIIWRKHRRKRNASSSKLAFVKPSSDDPSPTFFLGRIWKR